MPPEPGRPSRTELIAQVADLAAKLDILAFAHDDHENRLARLEGWVETLRADRRNGNGVPPRAPGPGVVVLTPSPQQ
jgi:hypothetical protein